MYRIFLMVVGESANACYDFLVGILMRNGWKGFVKVLQVFFVMVTKIMLLFERKSFKVS